MVGENTKVRNLSFISVYEDEWMDQFFMLVCSLCRDICRGRRRHVILVPQIIWKI
jgi:hypothetical protein